MCTRILTASGNKTRTTGRNMDCSIVGTITNKTTFADPDTYDFLLPVHGISDNA